MHMCVDCARDQLNPRAFHTFSGEDYMGYLKRVAQFTPCGRNFEHRLLKRSFLKMMSLTAGAMKRFYDDKSRAKTL